MFCYGYVFSLLIIEHIASDFFGILLRLGDRTLPTAIGLIRNLDQLVPAILAIAQIKEGATHNNNINEIQESPMGKGNDCLKTSFGSCITSGRAWRLGPGP